MTQSMEICWKARFFKARIGRRNSLSAISGCRCGEQKVVKQPCMLPWWPQSKRVFCREVPLTAVEETASFFVGRASHESDRRIETIAKKKCMVVCAMQRRQAARMSDDRRSVQGLRRGSGSAYICAPESWDAHRRIWRKHGFWAAVGNGNRVCSLPPMNNHLQVRKNRILLMR